MPDTPLLDRLTLENTFDKYQAGPINQPDLPNVANQGLDNPIPLTGNGQARNYSALDSLEASVINSPAINGKLKGGSIPRSLAESTSSRFNQYVPGYNNEDAYAQGQSWGDKVVNGVGKGLALTATTFLQSTVGLVNGVFQYIGDGRAASFYDNDFNRALDDLNKQLEDSLPNYYTDVEKNASWYSPSKLFTANFFWDGIVKNLGFAAGAALSGGVFAAGLKALPLTARLFAVGKAAETLAATEEAVLATGKSAAVYGKVKALSDRFLGSYKAMNQGGRVLVAGLATTGEAGFEAFHNLNEFRDAKLQEYRDTHGGMDATGKDLDAINAQSDNVGNSSFILNTALLSATNYIQFPKILGSSYRAEKSVINSLKKEIGEITEKVGVYSIPKASRLLSRINKVRPYLFSVTEGFEEGAQYATTRGTQDYYDKKYKGETADFVSSLVEGISETVGTDEGMENILIGGLSGALMLGRGRFKQDRARTTNTQAAVTAFNKTTLSDFTKGTLDAVKRGTVIQEEREKHLKQGDILESKDSEADYIINYLTPRIKYGRYDLVKSDIDEYRQLAATDEGFAQLQSEGKVIEGDTKEQYLQRLVNLEATAENIKSLWQSLNIRYGGLVDKDKKPLYSSAIMDKMIYAATKIADYDKRIPELSRNLLAAGIDINTVINDALEGKGDSLNEAYDAVLKLKTVKEDDLLQDLLDIPELALRRDKFVKEYDEIKKSPTTFQEASEIPTAPATPTVKIKTKAGELDYEIGVEYYLGKVTEHDAKGHEVYRFPTITILGKNEDGTIKIKTSTGEIRDIKASVLEDYKLGRVSDTQNNKKAKFYFDNINSIFEFNFGNGKKVTGRLQFSTKEGILLFTYRSGKKLVSTEVTGDQFKPKKGFTKALITKVGDLTAVQKKSLEDFANEEDTRMQAKRTGRLGILEKLVDETGTRITQVQTLIKSKEEELGKIATELDKLQEKISKGEFTKKGNFKATTRRALNTANKLANLKAFLETEIETLNTEKEELEFNLEYFYDLAHNIDELPASTGDFISEINEQALDLALLIEETGRNINSISSLLDKIQGALDNAISWVQENIKLFQFNYPKAPLDIDSQDFVDFLKGNPNFLKLQPEYKEDLRKLEELVSQVEDLDIIPGERTVGELSKELKGIQEALAQLEKEYKAKTAIIDRFAQAAKEIQDQKAAEEKLKRDKQIQEQLFQQSKVLTERAGENNGNFDDAQIELAAVEEDSSFKIATSIIYNTTSEASEDWNPQDAEKMQAFLSKAAGKKGLVGRIITVKQETAYGLKGLAESIAAKFPSWESLSDEDKKAQLENPDSSAMVQIYVVEKQGKLYFADENGDATDVEFKKQTEQIDLQSIMFSTLRGTTGKWTTGETETRAGEEEQAAIELAKYKKKREAYWNAPDAIPTIFVISRGLPVYDKKEDDTYILHSVQETLLPDLDPLRYGPVLFVADASTITHNGQEIPVRKGRIYLRYLDKFVPLINRKFNSQEQNVLYKALIILANKTRHGFGWDKQLLSFMENMVFMSNPEVDKEGNYIKIGRNQIWVDNATWTLHIGRKEVDGKLSPAVSVSFTAEAIKANEALIKGYFKGAYNNIKNKTIKENNPFYEITDISEDGEITTKEYLTYQHFLIEKELVKSALKPLSEGRNFKQKYTIYSSPAGAEVAPVPATKPAATPTATPTQDFSTFVDDGSTTNRVTLAGGEKLDFVFVIPTEVSFLKASLPALAAARKRLAADPTRVVEIRALDPEAAKKSDEQLMEEFIRATIRDRIMAQQQATIQVVAPVVADPAQSEPAIVVAGAPFSIPATQFSIADDFSVERMSENEKKEFKAFMKAYLPQFSIIEVEELINATADKKAWGALVQDVIAVFKNAKRGTGYHEAFEGVWKYFLTQEQKEAIEMEVGQRESSFIDRPSGLRVLYSEATPFQIKEKLADEFADKILAKPVKIKNKVRAFFDRIIKFFKTFGKSKTLTDQLFDKIGRGDFRKAKLPVNLDANPEFSRVEGLTASETNAYVGDMTFRFFNHLLLHQADLFESYKEHGTNIFEEIRTAYGAESSPAFDQLVTKVKEKLRTFHIEFDEDNRITINEDEVNRNDYANDKMTMDIKKSSPFPIKFLLSALIKTTREGENDNGLPLAQLGPIKNAQLLPAARTFITIMEAVTGSTTVDEMIYKLQILANKDRDYVRMVSYLNGKSGAFDFDNLNEANWRLLAAFYNTFNKQKPEAVTLVTQEGDTFFQNAHLGNAVEQTKREWFSNIRAIAKSGKGLFTTYNREKKTYEVTADFKALPTATGEERIAFLNKLGIQFTMSEYTQLTGDEKDKIIGDSVASIKEYLTINGIKTVGRKTLGINGAMTKIATLFVKITRPEAESTYRSSEGKQKQVFVQPNIPSQFEQIFNTVDNLDEAKKLLPWLTDAFATSSEILKLGGHYFKATGERTSVPIKVTYIEAREEDGRKTSISNMGYPQRLITQINGVLEDIHTVSVPADGSTEWALRLKALVTDVDLANNSDKHLLKLIEYLKDEINLALENRTYINNIGNKTHNLRFFADILDEDNLRAANQVIATGRKEGTVDFSPLNEEKLKKNFKVYFAKAAKELKETMAYNNLFFTVGENMLVPGIIGKTELSQEDFSRLLDRIVINDFYGQTEIHKLIIGDPFAFKISQGGKILEETKRVKSLLSPAAPTLVSESYNKLFSKNFNNINGFPLNPKIPGYINVRNHVTSGTLSDVKIIGKKASTVGYDNTNEADAQGIHTIMMEMDLLNRHHKLDKAKKAWYKYEMAYTRQKMLEKGQFAEEDYPKGLQAVDKKTLQKRRPEAIFDVKKPIVRGRKANSDLNDMVVDKFSSYPIWYSGVEGTNNEQLFVKMFKENIDYFVVESGRKVGTQGTHDIYNRDGSFNTEPVDIDTLVDVSWDTYNIQLETSYQEGKGQTRGSQVTKLFSLDFYDEGIPQSEEAHKNILRNDRALEELTELGYISLLRKLGITDNGTNFLVKSYAKLRKTLLEEAGKRDMTDNVRELFKGNTLVPFEASSEYIRIQNMLFSMVDKAIVSPTVNGGPKVQISPMGWEDIKEGRALVLQTKDGYVPITQAEYKALSPEEQKKVKLTSSKLKWYEDKDGERYMEVMLPHWFKDKLRLSSKLKNMTDDELLAHLNTRDGRELLTGVGFRIPTSGMNAIEVFRVHSFLPQEYGDTVVVPSEITTKTGSDFDIDKLQMYLKNAYIDENGNLKAVPFFGYGEDAKKKLSILLTKSLAGQETDKVSFVDILQEPKDYFEDINLDPEVMEGEEEVDRFYRQSIENEYYNSMIDTVQDPTNFERWMRPLDNPTLKNLADELAKATGTEEKTNLDRILSLTYNSKLRQSFMVAKQWIGIGAVNITGHSQAQRSDIYLDIDRAKNLKEDDRLLLGDGKVLLQHNVNKDGKVSISKILNRNNKVISDILNWFTNAFVDVSKDPYITNIIPSKKVVGTFMFLTRVGVPVDEMAFFMNQPIIREFLHFSDLRGFSRLSTYWKDEFYKSTAAFTNKVPAATKLDKANFKKNIEDYYTGTTIDMAQQNLVLNEFLKYFKMAEHSFKFNQAIKWDTTNFRTSGSVYQSQQRTLTEEENNIWSSPNKILTTTNNGQIRDKMLSFREALSSFLDTHTAKIRLLLDTVLHPYATLQGYLSPKDYEKIDNKITTTFIDFLVHIGYDMNKYAAYLLTSEKNLANRIRSIQESPEALASYGNNPIFNYLKAQIADSDKAPNTVRLSPLPKEVYDKNTIIDSLRELKEMELDIPAEQALYRDIVKFAILQGTGDNTNLQSYIPIEDIAAMLKPEIDKMQTNDLTSLYESLHMFQRNNWSNDEAVPELKNVAKMIEDSRSPHPKLVHNMHNTILGVAVVDPRFTGSLSEYPVIKAKRFQKIADSGNWIDILTKKQYGGKAFADILKAEIDKGDFSRFNWVGFQKVLKADGTPLLSMQYEKKTDTYYPRFLYKQINLWGTPSLQEFHVAESPSIYDNGTVSAETVLSDEEIFKITTKYSKPEPIEVQGVPIDKAREQASFAAIDNALSKSKEIAGRLKDVIKSTAKKWLSKEEFKANRASQYIGDGKGNDSSTERYKKLYENYGLANTGKYSATDTIWVSSNGKRGNRVNPVVDGKLQGVYTNIDKAIATKASIIMDTAQHIQNTASYNIGEVALAEYMDNHGYVRDDKTGIWTPATSFEDFKNSLKRKDC